MIGFALRAADLGGFVNEDEIRYWLSRSSRFLHALELGDFGATAISTHPGVTTMWLGSVGILLRRLLVAWEVVETVPFALKLALMRLPVVVVHTAGIVVGYGLMRRMLPLSIAVIAVILWTTDPFIIGFSRLLHVDGLAMTFSTVSILSAATYWLPNRQQKRSSHHRHLPWLALSGVCAGLAILSKSPALALIPTVGIFALWMAWEECRSQGEGIFGVAKRLWPLAVWGGVSLLTMVVVWPAFWVDPMRVYDLLRIGVEVEGGSPHVQGNFFLGREDNEPGLHFYPVALALRLTPLAMIGLFLAPLGWRRLASLRERRTLAICTLFALIFIGGISLFPKKLNRYLIPAFVMVDIVAAVGIAGAIHLIAHTVVSRWRGRYQRLTSAVVAGVATIALLNAVWWHPYGIAAFNQLLGGERTAANTFLMGSGEGLEQVAAWLNLQPDITGVVTVATMPPPLQPYMRPRAFAGSPKDGKLRKQTGYVVVYIRNVWGDALPPFDRFYGRISPVYTVDIHGVTYAWVYQVPQPLEERARVVFGDGFELHSYEYGTSWARLTHTLPLTLQWYAHPSEHREAVEPLERDYLLFTHLFDEQGTRIAQIDVPPAGGDAPTSDWHAHRYYLWTHPLPLPPDIAPGRYWLSIGLYDPNDFSRLPIAHTEHTDDTGHTAHSDEVPDAVEDGARAFFLAPVYIK